jgi:3-oxoacyl-[acyl-carrier-protein] synthase II
MTAALKDSGLAASDIDYVNAHGTSTMADGLELGAVTRLLGDHAKNVAMSSTKSMTGHLLGATGALEFAICVLAIQRGIIPPTINQFQQDPACDLDCAPNRAVERQVEVALSNSFGFGGHNVSLAVCRFLA